MMKYENLENLVACGDLSPEESMMAVDELQQLIKDIKQLEEDKSELLQAMFNDDEQATYNILLKHGMIRKQKLSVVIDVETTGLSDNDELTEIAIVKFDEEFEVVDTYQSLIKPSIDIPQFITEKTGISNELVEEERPFSEVAPEVESFLTGIHVLYAHNSSFDSRMLFNAFNRVGTFFNADWQCTKQIAKQHIESDSYSLAPLCELLGIELKSHHRAMPDAMATFELLKKLNHK